jgi:hypothetical protein
LPTHFTTDVVPSASVAASTSAASATIKPIQSSLSRRRAEASRVRALSVPSPFPFLPIQHEHHA